MVACVKYQQTLVNFTEYFSGNSRYNVFFCLRLNDIRPLLKLAISEINARSHVAENRRVRVVHEDSSNVAT
jgi:hypothetical protein